MKSYTTTAASIALKIWVIALLINTIADTLLIGGFSVGTTAVLFLTGLFGGLFSLPIFIIIWIIIYNFLKTEKSASYIFKWLLFAGISMAITAWIVFAGSFRFFDEEMIGLMVAAPLSGTLAITACYSDIKKACFARDEENNLPDTFMIDQTVSN